MKVLFTALLGIISLATATPGNAQQQEQESPAPEPRVEPAIPVPESETPESEIPAAPSTGTDVGVEPVEGPESTVTEDVGAPAEAEPIPEASEPEMPETPIPNKKEVPSEKAGSVPNAAAAAPPTAAPSKTGKPLDWEQNIVRVSILDDMRPITVPVEGKEAMGQPAVDSKLPRVISPYPPKALSPVPDGWQLYTDTTVPVRLHRVKFKDGRTLDIGVFPPALMPANPEATTLVLPQSAGNLLGAITAARESQSKSKATLEALIEAMNRQLPAAGPQSTPVP